MIQAGPRFTTWILSGALTREDLAGLSVAARGIVKGDHPLPGWLIDLTGVTDFDISFVDVFARVKERGDHTACPPRTAVLVASPVQRGFGRMYQAIIMHPKNAVEVFADRRAAERWLETGRGGAESAAS